MALNNNVLLAAVLTLMQSAPEGLKADIQRMAEESKAATADAEAAKAAGDSRTASKSGLLHTMRHVAATIATTPNWGREHFEAALLMAIQAGGNEASLKAYRSTLGTFIEGTKREANPLNPAMLSDESVAYVDLRNALKSDDAAERSNIRTAINKALGVLNQDSDLADLRKVLEAVTAITDPVAARKEADKAESGAGKVAPPKAVPAGEVAEVAPIAPQIDVPRQARG